MEDIIDIKIYNDERRDAIVNGELVPYIWLDENPSEESKGTIVKYMNTTTGKFYAVNPNINDTFYDAIFKKGFNSGSYILRSGNLPDKWK